jgi:cation transport ATPase
LPDNSSIQSILNRPISERIREHKYRFAQCMVFGLPVIALYLFGPRLGGPETGRWIGMLQLLLSGWCLYIGALPLLSEGAMLLAMGKFRTDLLIGLAAVIVYVVGVVGWVLTLRGEQPPMPSTFSIVVVVLIVWSGAQWLRLSNRTTRD